MKLILILIQILIISTSYAMEIPSNKRIDHWVSEYTGRLKPHLKASLLRSRLYRKEIVKIFREKGVPEEISWLPIVESGFNCASNSNKNAAGCWQFIKSTGNAYGLNRGSWKDSRYDFHKSTIAASNYLLSLYKLFGDWNLAIAAYNAGPTSINSAIIKSKSNNYWDLVLSKETMDYIPKFYAILKIVSNPKRYEIKEENESLEVVELKRGSHSLRRISSILMIDYDEFLNINPGFDVEYTQPGEITRIYVLKEWDVKLLQEFGLLEPRSQN